jgi:antitoxin component of MazEF toxin-antitoxin module
MIIQKLRRAGNSLVVTIPRDEIERQGLSEGELVAVDVRRVEVRPALPADLAAHVEKLGRDQRLTSALRYLKDH